MKYLIDTNVLSDARRRRSASLMAWLADQMVGDLAFSAITLLELERGIQLKERRDPEGARALRRWFTTDVASLVDGRVLPVTEAVAARAAGLHVPDPMPEMDALIAATALVHDLVLVTRNVGDFSRSGVRLFDPW